MKALLERLKESEHSVEVLRTENVVLRSDLSDLRKHVITNEQKLEENNDKVNRMDEKQYVWRKKQEEEQISFKKVMEKQMGEEDITKAVVGVIKNRSTLVRDTVEKKKMCYSVWSQ